MIRSMTGFAAVSRGEADQTVHVTLKSVNHRFLDLAIKAPSSVTRQTRRNHGSGTLQLAQLRRVG